MRAPTILPSPISVVEQRYRAAISASFDAFFLIEPVWNSASRLSDFRYLDLNERGAQLLGRTREEILGHYVCELIPQVRENGAFDRYAQVLADGMPTEEEFEVEVPGIAGTWFRHQILRVGGLIAVTTRDITQQRRTDEAIRASEQQLRVLIEQSPTMTYILEHTINESLFMPVFVSPQISSILGFSPEEWIGNADLLRASIYPEDRAKVIAEVAAGNQMGRFQAEFRMIAKDGHPVWVHHNVRRLEATVDGIERWLGVMSDVSAVRRSHDEIRFQAALLNSVPSAVVGTDLEGNVTHWNEYAAELYGWSSDEAIGRSITELVLPDEVDVFAESRIKILQDGVHEPSERLLRKKDGTVVPVQIFIGPVRNEAGCTVGLVGVSVDLTEKRETDAKLYHLAYHDQVTGLANRTLFVEQLHERLASHGPGGLTVFFIDLDRFKVVNDSLGHAAGDRLLQKIGERLASTLRSGTVLARFGGDEFMAICDGLSDPQGAIAIGRRILGAFSKPFDLDGRETMMNASIGIATAGDASIDAGELLRRADVAMYEAKAAGRGRWSLFNPESNKRTLSRLSEEAELRQALEHDQLEIHYQPVVDLETGAIHGLEALVRWRHPERGLVSPGTFIPLAIETGLIIPIGEWVLRRACQQAARWRREFPGRDYVMAVNVAPAQFYRPEFMQELWQILSSTGLPPSSLKLEVTEDALAIETSQMHDLFEQLKSLGIRLAIDDFGTGYSSLSRLHAFPLDVVKIDRSFVSKLGDDSSSKAIVQAICSLGHSLGLNVTAEGIETSAQRDLARGLGCDRGQGFLFSRPLPAEKIAVLLREHAEGAGSFAVG